MKVFVTGVGGQLGHDVMNELSKRGIEGIGSDIAPAYSGVADGTAVTTMPYVQMDITDGEAVASVLAEVKPDVVVHCAAWTAVDAAEDDENRVKVHVINADGIVLAAKTPEEISSSATSLSAVPIFPADSHRKPALWISAVVSSVVVVLPLVPVIATILQDNPVAANSSSPLLLRSMKYSPVPRMNLSGENW